MSSPAPTITWATLGTKARAWRIAHAAWSVTSMAALGYIWLCAAARRRDRALAASMIWLSLEGIGLAIGRGDCPMGGKQAEWGDPVPFFELLLPPRAAKAAVPVLLVITLGGFAAVALRRPRKR